MNKALKEYGYLRRLDTDKSCVFLSHKKEDQAIAEELGNFLMKKMDVDIYLDIYDPILQEAVSVENDAKIVASITKGLKMSDILLCIVSDKTRLSWWVPYEIGVADHAGLKIASIRTKFINDFPSFLKTKQTIDQLSDLVSFISKNCKHSYLHYNEQWKPSVGPNDFGRLKNFFD